VSDQAQPEPTEAHSPTSAGPDPTPVVGAGEASFGQPAGSALLDGGPAGAPEDPHPEKQVGKAFAGGLGAAILLKILANRKHR
jgi:hypothetical protein